MSTAVLCGPTRLTYRELDSRASRLARRLVSLGVKEHDLVGVCLPRNLDLPVALLAVWKAGGAFVPLDPTYPSQRLAAILSSAAPRAIVTDSALRRCLPSSDAIVIETDHDRQQPGGDPPRWATPVSSPRSLAYVIYTSGTTGAPKGVMVDHGNLLNTLTAMQAHLNVGTSDVFACLTTFAFDIAILEVLLPLMQGAIVALSEARELLLEGRDLGSYLADVGATFAQATPTTWDLLIQAGWEGKKGLTLVVGGEKLPRTLAKRLTARARSVVNAYGPTEATIWSSVYHVTGHEKGDPPIGLPLANTSLHVLDEGGRPAPPGEPGELYIGGSGVGRGYHREAALTADRFVPDPFAEQAGSRLYRTGDRAKTSVDGDVEFLGRLDFQVKIHGHRVECGEIESRLLEHPAVAQAVVTVHDPAGIQDQRLVAYVVATPGTELSIPRLRNYLKESLPTAMVPSRFIELDRLPRTENGKIDRGALPALTVGPDDVGDGDRPLEETLAELWAALFGLAEVKPDDDFFELGGDSLLTLELAGKVRQLGFELSPVDIFNYPTVAKLARFAVSPPSGRRGNEQGGSRSARPG